MTIRTLSARAGITLGAAAVLALAVPLAASAHVRVNPDQVEAGSYSTLTFKVPTESATAGTVKLVVDLPTDTPFTSVSYKPMAGWTTEVTTSTLPKPVEVAGATVTEAPTSVTWTADPGVQVGPGEFDEFVVSAGAMPDTGSIVLPAHQYYSDGTVVDWAEATPASGEEPEYPAPTLYINDEAPSGGHHGAAVAADDSATGDGDASQTAVVGLGLGIAGLALGAIALVVAVLALTRRPRATATTEAGRNR